ncbi:bifunctional (p)ppGpp synthetase/guanosine-3',5'-bis(diphosphate) 3'-pyrophosphohydrolase [Tepidimonas taiwanensis]|uniref:GTP pyrophosphokinase n=1 Tax=Tepidimonas taiwanensis TaxID=307486 RepID=A0A554X3S2_9BURK|nr:bifunctional (p)ppGpp synthetase/guanosine-3',5'-bis(diphosphate) 3'-pyrophosphohydrolase [Tepidimonas taiwanensis]MCX7692905.1 bifunctional (p)ppGpp synthetase/guanosine-3',5'-bis(diphosphate) 3'-pyrophosphohydrolase [Tepidimonas taiwanensis]TSE30487.1 GTP pyrophosphokinase [Tepidimonas taiwanensis]UBQ06352.1 bifunctional (p)ppGpp synthetase/guanosine-3',5'-bis(diphosphate) 3'-pyrophosphohydrolase [Tepidimonas taiwanensis]
MITRTLPAVAPTEAATAITAALATPAPTGDGEEQRALQRARAFAEPLLTGEVLDTGEPVLDHADAVVEILRHIGGNTDLQVCVYLVYTTPYLARPREAIAKAFGEPFADVAVETHKLVELQRQARRRVVAEASNPKAAPNALEAAQTENVRKMLLAFSRDLRVVLLRLASRLQTLRYFAAVKREPPQALAAESLHVFAPLANRLGIWQLKWELEDLAFRFLEPETYKHIARLLDEKRVEREQHVEQVRQRLEQALTSLGLRVQVQGRPKHIYSIVKKMRGKSLDFDHVYDLRALRVIVETVDECYRVLAWVHEHFTPVPEEFDDYIAKPKPNGYQSLHTVVRDEQGRAFEIQIRTRAMHEHAEHGVAAHWAYKEAGTKGYAGVTAGSSYDAKIAVLRQLLAWQRDLGGGVSHALFDDRIYVLTPQAAIVELPKGATPVDFAYAVHTDLGHRCRGARVDGQMVPLNTPLANGQTVEIIAAKEGGPSRDWLNPEAGYLVSHRAKSKVRAWFNAQAAAENVARGREQVERLLQREGKTSVNLDELALEMGFDAADALFEAVGKEAVSLRAIEQRLRPAEPVPAAEVLSPKPSRQRAAGGPSGVVVVGVGALMTTLARCCKPAPPDDIRGFVTRGKGVSVHRADCPDFLALAKRQPARVIDVEWAAPTGGGAHAPVYAVDVGVQAQDRQGLLRDISEAFAREKINVVGVQTQSVKGVAWMTFTVEVNDATRVQRVMAVLNDVPGVLKVWRR